MWIGNGALVRMDVVQFQRVLENLLSNSIKYKAGEEGYLVIGLSVDGFYFRLDKEAIRQYGRHIKFQSGLCVVYMLFI